MPLYYGIRVVLHSVEGAVGLSLGGAESLSERFLVLDFLQFLKFVQQLIGAETGLFHDGHGALACAFKLLLLLLLQVGQLLLQLALGHLCVALGYCGAFLERLQFLPGLLKGVHHLLEPLILGADKLLGAVDYIVRHSQALGYRERVGFAGNPDNKPVGRLERIHVEFTGGVLNSLGLEGVHLDLLVMRRGGDLCALFTQGAEYRHGKRRALHGVGAASQLVYEHQAAVVRQGEYLHHVHHMR